MATKPINLKQHESNVRDRLDDETAKKLSKKELKDILDQSFRVMADDNKASDILAAVERYQEAGV